MIEQYYNQIVANPFLFFLWTVVSGGVGVLIGHWLAMGRDRRVEFNQAAEKYFLILDADFRQLSPMTNDVVRESGSFERHLGWIKRRQFNEAIARYSQAREDSLIRDELGGSYFPNKVQIQEVIEELIEFTKRR